MNDYEITQHLYEVSPRSSGAFIRATGGRKGCIAAAVAWLDAHPAEAEVGCYHSYPHGGPLRRFMGNVKRIDGTVRFCDASK
jgi:hypothetical protein